MIESPQSKVFDCYIAITPCTYSRIHNILAIKNGGNGFEAHNEGSIRAYYLQALDNTGDGIHFDNTVLTPK